MKKRIWILTTVLMLAAAACSACSDSEFEEIQAVLEDEEAEEPEEPVETVEDAEEPEVNENAGPESSETGPESAETEPESTDMGAGGSALCIDTVTLDGESVNTGDIFSKNKFTVVNVWASWCGPCVSEIPELGAMNGELEDKGCGIVGMLIDGDDPMGLKDAKAILSESSATYTNVVCPGTVLDALEIQTVPTTFFVDSKGNLAGETVHGVAPELYLETVNSLLSTE